MRGGAFAVGPVPLRRGIVIRNSIVLIEFIHAALHEGKPLREALLDSGAVRLRPIFLTAITAMLGAWPITLDPVFSGLAWALIFGLFASTTFTLLVIPAVYYMVYGKEDAERIGARVQGSGESDFPKSETQSPNPEP